MYGVFFNLKSDTRKLLLDYTMSENPMLKDFSCESSTDVFYNIFEEKVCYIQNNIIEL
jgi:NADH:ubiquinone oxidoreductase subunit C